MDENVESARLPGDLGVFVAGNQDNLLGVKIQIWKKTILELNPVCFSNYVFTHAHTRCWRRREPLRMPAMPWQRSEGSERLRLLLVRTAHTR